jgi:2-methylcitrate dehydratase PrpD
LSFHTKQKGESMSEKPILNRISEYIAAAGQRQLPADVSEKAKHHILDTIAAMVSDPG